MSTSPETVRAELADAAAVDRRVTAARNRTHQLPTDSDGDTDVLAALVAWDPAAHPRDGRGRFTAFPSGGGAGGSAPSAPSAARLADQLTRGDATVDALSTDELRQVDAELAARAEQLGRPGQRSRAHQKVRAELDERSAAEDELERHIGHLQRTLAAATPTDQLYQREDGTWAAERQRHHDAIINDLYAQAANVPRDGKALVSGGLGGAGKSTVLKNHLGISGDDYLTVNPDDIKEEMARRGMIPEFPGISPMEASPLVHEESSHIAKELANKAYADRTNMIWDITMASSGSVLKRLGDMREAGYNHIGAVFVDIPVETSVKRAMGRYEQGLSEWRDGEGLGGRFVPPDMIREHAARGWSSENRRTFEQLKPQFDGWVMYNTSDTATRVGSEGSIR